MKTKFLWAALALVLLAGCQKDGGVGRTIRFSAVTRTTGDTGTRAAYSGVLDASNYERINWSSGDKIVMAMKHDTESNAQQVYSITGIRDNGRYSEAGLIPFGQDTGLQWGTGTHDFWAACPSLAAVGDHTLSGTISSSQNQNYSTTNSGVAMYESDQPLILFAGLQVAGSAVGDAISLEFYPMMTTFDFEVNSTTTQDLIIRSIEMTTEYAEEYVADANLRALTGVFTTTYDTNDSMSWTVSTTAATSSNRSISVGFTPQPAVSQTKKVRFRVMALPQTIQGLSVVFHTTETRNGVEQNMLHRLNLKQYGEWISFPGRVKANISGILIPGAEWTIRFSGPRVQQWTVYDEVIIGVE